MSKPPVDYFTEFDIKQKKCIKCVDHNCQYGSNYNVCNHCMSEYINEYNAIYAKIKNYYDNINSYDIEFVKAERVKANKDINDLKVLYKLL